MNSTAAGTAPRKLDISKLLIESRAFLALALIIVIFSLLSPNFLTVNNLLIMSSHVAIFALLSLGQLLVVLTGGIDLSVGSILGFTAVIAGFLAARRADQHVRRDPVPERPGGGADRDRARRGA